MGYVRVRCVIIWLDAEKEKGKGKWGVIADGSDENVYFSHGCILRAYNSAGNIVDIQ